VGAFASLISTIGERSDPASLSLLSERNAVFGYNLTFASIPVISIDPRLYFSTESEEHFRKELLSDVFCNEIALCLLNRFA